MLVWPISVGVFGQAVPRMLNGAPTGAVATVYEVAISALAAMSCIYGLWLFKSRAQLRECLTIDTALAEAELDLQENAKFLYLLGTVAVVWMAPMFAALLMLG